MVITWKRIMDINLTEKGNNGGGYVSFPIKE
jgi:hypothetical protein